MDHRLVFVFGTLKAGFPNSGTNTGRREPGEFSTALAFPFYLVGERHSPWLLNTEADIRLGPFPVYTQEHAALYRKRGG